VSSHPVAQEPPLNPLQLAYSGYGARLYGRTLRVPDTLFVSTRFLHAWLFPLVPRSSWVTLNEDVAAQFGLEPGPHQLSQISWRSVLLTLLRTSFSFLLFFAAIVISTQVLLDRSIEAMAPTALVLVAVPTCFWLTYRLDRPTPQQLEVLMKDLPEELVRFAATRL